MTMLIDAYRFDSGGGGTAFQAITSYGLDGGSSSGSARYGWTFTVTGGDLLCDSLYVILNSVSVNSNERVIVHRNSDSAVMAQADIVPASANVVASTAVTPFTLVNGLAYTVSTRNPGFSRNFRISNTINYYAGLGSISGVNGLGDGRPTGADATVRRFCWFGHS